MSDVNEVKKKQENHFLRTACAIFLLFFIYTHYYPEFYISGINVNDMIFGMGRFAIPVFFLISGYFTFSKDGHSENNLPKKTLHIIYLIIFMKVAYLIIDVIYSLIGNTCIDWEYTWHELYGVEDTTLHIWFVYSLLLTYAIWLIFWKFKIDYKWTMAIGTPLLIADMLLCEILPMAGVDTQSLGELTYPFISIAFFGFGYYIHKYKDQIDAKITNSMIVWMLIIGAVLAFFETLWVVSSGITRCNMFFNSFILAFAIFYGSFRLREDQLRCRWLEYIGKDLLPWFYALFGASIFFVKNVILVDFEKSSFMFDGLGPFIAMAVNFVAAFLVNLLIIQIGKKAKQKKKSNNVNITPQ